MVSLCSSCFFRAMYSWVCTFWLNTFSGKNMCVILFDPIFCFVFFCFWLASGRNRAGCDEFVLGSKESYGAKKCCAPVYSLPRMRTWMSVSQRISGFESCKRCRTCPSPPTPSPPPKSEGNPAYIDRTRARHTCLLTHDNNMIELRGFTRASISIGGGGEG